MKTVFKPGLYAITPQCYPDASRVLRDVGLALEGGASMVQFRDKSRDDAWRQKVASGLQSICAQFAAPLIINDDVQLAATVGASGVHLGEEDLAIETARAVLGNEALIGVSCYNALDRAEAAAAEGADYLAFGSVFPSATKPNARRCPLELVSGAHELGLPVVAIGGITAENGRAVIEAGADGLAVISAVFGAQDVKAAAESFSQLWTDQPDEACE